MGGCPCILSCSSEAHFHLHLDFSSLRPFKAGIRLHELIPCTKLFKAGITKGPPGRGEKEVKVSILAALAV